MVENKQVIWPLTWLNKSVATLNATLQLLDIYIDDSMLILFLLNFFSVSVKTERSGIMDYQDNGGHNEDLELPFFDLSIIVCAIENFAINKKIGEGGFGSVYMVSL